ncbi:MAG: phosphatase PAP2 family protein [Chitinophagaceae bacterium]|nr:phosphatase PAP2 family protein [Chitinophagaceae bacterium]
MDGHKSDICSTDQPWPYVTSQKFTSTSTSPEPLVAGITNFSFPSGHAFMGITFYGLLIWMIAVHVKNKWQKGLAITLLSLLIIVIGLSRVYLRVHYTTDVLAGFSIGFLWLIACLNIIEKAESGFVNKS